MTSTENSKMPDSSPTPKTAKEESRFVINICRKFKISICKPLIPLKIVLTLWFTASMGISAYLTLFFTQRGLTVEEISYVYLAGYLSQFVISTACGVVSDKIGRPLYMTVLSIFLAGSLASCVIFIPKVNETIEENRSFSSLYCSEADYVPLQINRTCDKELQIIPCEKVCTQECCKEVSPKKLNLMDKFANDSVFSSQNGSEYSFNWCFRDNKTVLFTYDTQSLCEVHQKVCAMTCAEHRSDSISRQSRVLFFIAVVVIFITFDENTYRFLDILANNMAKTFESEFGKQVFWSNIGALTGPSLIAIIVQKASTSEEVPNYESFLYFYAGIALITIATLCTLDVSKVKSSQEMSRAAIKLFKNVDFLFFIFILFVLGGTFGFLLNFHNLFLADIGTPIYMMGLLDTFAGLYGLPVMLAGKWLTDKIGHTNVFSLALLCYFLKCFGYSFLRNAWPVFFLELFTMMSYNLLWIAVIDYCGKIAPENLKGTVIMLAGTIHYSLGRACGSFVGGLLFSKYGAAAAFQLIGLANGAAFLIYSLYLLLRRFRRKQKVDIS